MKKTIVIASLIYFLVLSFRIIGAGDLAPQSDEMLWLSRSYGVLEKFRAKDYQTLTSHLPHPGIPPTFVFAIAEGFADRYNKKNNYSIGGEGYLDRLSSSRVAAVIVTSLIAPVLFLFAKVFFGTGIALVASLLWALDPVGVELGRLVHIDGMLTLFILLIVSSYAYALHSNLSKWKVVAGFFWGLAIATKPTAAIILFPLLLIRILIHPYFSDRRERAFRKIFSFSDYWTCWFGLVVMSLLYTRLWTHYPPGYNRYKLNAESLIKEKVFLIGNELGHYAVWIVPILILIGLVLFWKKQFKLKELVNSNLFQSFLVFLSFFLPLIFFPQVIENLIGFATWVCGLSGESHQAWGRVWEPPAYGYLESILSHLPSMIVIGTLLSLCFFLFYFKRFQKAERFIFVVCLVVVFGWILPLSASKKQAFRYAYPAVPFIYLFVVGVLGVAVKKYLSKKQIGLLVFLALLVQSATLILAYPDYGLYFNKITGGVSEAIKRGHILPFAGEREMVEYLIKAASKRKQPLVVGVYGDPETIEYEYRRQNNSGEKLLKFVPSIGANNADFATVSGSFFRAYQEKVIDMQGIENSKEVLNYKYQGVSVSTLLELPYLEYKTPLLISADKAGSQVGKKKWFVGNEEVDADAPKKEVYLLADPRNTPNRGYMFFGQDLRVSAGVYNVTFELGKPKSDFVVERDLLDKAALKLEVGSRCYELVPIAKLSDTAITKFTFTCETTEPARFQLRAYWFKRIPVFIKSVSLVKENGHSVNHLQ